MAVAPSEPHFSSFIHSTITSAVPLVNENNIGVAVVENKTDTGLSTQVVYILICGDRKQVYNINELMREQLKGNIIP